MSPKTLQQRITLFILLPVFFLLIGIGGAGFLYARKVLLDQWGETAIAKLQKAAHLINMRLNRPKELLLMLSDNSNPNQNQITQQFILDHLRDVPGVVQVEVDWPKRIYDPTAMPDRMTGMGMMGAMHSNRMENLQVSLPQYNAKLNSKTISVSTDFHDENDRKVGRIEVVLAFNDLIGQIVRSPWWKSYKAFLVDDDGNILSSSLLDKDKQFADSQRKFGKDSPLERKTLAAIKQNASGTIFGSGHPPKEISGYYHLGEAPWTLVIIAPGEQVLRPFLQFRFYYFVGGLIFVVALILFIRVVIGQTASSIKKVSDAAHNLANGKFGKQLPVVTKDEVGELTRNFNKMTKQLEDRLRLQKAMHIAMDVQQNLLPASNLSIEGIDVSGTTMYCDETGGDYYDIIEFPDQKDKLCIVVGDVVGHGIGAALLMTTTRALLRSRIMQPGSLAQVVSDVNRLLCLDTSHSGSFVTLFVMVIDTTKHEISWVRAGHEPAMFFDSQKKQVSDIKGDGVILGVDGDWQYQESILCDIPSESIVLIGTDGAWDVENEIGARFGRDSVVKLFKELSNHNASEIIQHIFNRIDDFKGTTHQNDDITLVAVKFK